MRKTFFVRTATMLFCCGALFASDVSGDWSGTLSPPPGTGPVVAMWLALSQTGTHVMGTIVSGRHVAELEGVIKGDQVSLGIPGSQNGPHVKLSFHDDELVGAACTAESAEDCPLKIEVVRLAPRGSQAEKPVEPNGVWVAMVRAPDGIARAYSLVLTEKGADIDGAILTEHGSLDLSSGHIDGKAMILTLKIGDVRVRFELKLDGDRLSGKVIQTGLEGAGELNAVKCLR